MTRCAYYADHRDEKVTIKGKEYDAGDLVDFYASQGHNYNNTGLSFLHIMMLLEGEIKTVKFSGCKREFDVHDIVTIYKFMGEEIDERDQHK